jgi:hypothetical protein
MKLHALIQSATFLVAFTLPAIAPAAEPIAAPPAAPLAKAPDVPYPEPPATLPGKGLAQHDFLYTGEFDTRKPVATLFLVRGGKVVWTYQIPTKDESNGQLSEYSDMHRLSNGDIVFAYKTGWRKIDATGKTIYDYKCPPLAGSDGKPILNPKGQPYYTECHSAQPIGMDRVLFMRNGVPAKLFLYNLKTGQIEMEHEVQTKYPGDPTHIHAQFRNVRMTRAGTYLLAHLDMGKVVEYDRNWKEIWSCDARSVWHAVRLTNGNTLAGGNQNAWAREFNAKGEVVWELKDGDLPGIKINSVHQAIRLANGNTVITNWTAGVKKPDWPKIVQLIEVTPDKKVVWAINEWKDPDLGPASCIQLLDEPGRGEAQELMR